MPLGTHSPYPAAIGELIDQFGRLPGIGPKSAQRIAFYLLRAPSEEADSLAASIREARSRVRLCEICCNLSVAEKCGICCDSRRDSRRICVVEDPKDVTAFERTGEFNGLYHVLQGALNPLEGVGPDQLKIAELLRRVETEDIEEVILGTNPNLEGEATSMYLAGLLGEFGLTVTGLARGLPAGGDLEYADEVTLGRALTGRREMSPH